MICLKSISTTLVYLIHPYVAVKQTLNQLDMCCLNTLTLLNRETEIMLKTVENTCNEREVNPVNNRLDIVALLGGVHNDNHTLEAAVKKAVLTFISSCPNLTI